MICLTKIKFSVFKLFFFFTVSTAVVLKMFINDFPFMESMSSNNNFVLKTEPYAEGTTYNGNVWITGKLGTFNIILWLYLSPLRPNLWFSSTYSSLYSIYPSKYEYDYLYIIILLLLLIRVPIIPAYYVTIIVIIRIILWEYVFI